MVPEFSAQQVSDASGLARSSVRDWMRAGVVPACLRVTGGGGQGPTAGRNFSLEAALHVVLAARTIRMTGAGPERVFAMLAPFALAGGHGGGWVDPATGALAMTHQDGMDRIPGLPFRHAETLILAPVGADPVVIPYRDLPKRVHEIGEGGIIINVTPALADLARVAGMAPDDMLRAAYDETATAEG